MNAEVRAEMVASVWKVLVEEGQAVEEDTTVVILESMKMEIPVVAGARGVVSSLRVAEGDSVNEDDLLMTVDEA